MKITHTLFSIAIVALILFLVSACEKKNVLNPGPSLQVLSPTDNQVLNRNDSVRVSVRVYDADGLKDLDVHVMEIAQNSTSALLTDIGRQTIQLSGNIDTFNTKMKSDTLVVKNKNTLCWLVATATDAEGATSEFTRIFYIKP